MPFYNHHKAVCAVISFTFILSISLFFTKFLLSPHPPPSSPLHQTHTHTHTHTHSHSQRCQFKCGSVGGMTYHYVRCEGVCERFSCPKCSRVYESRTGLNYHMASNSCTSTNTPSTTTPNTCKEEVSEIKTVYYFAVLWVLCV